MATLLVSPPKVIRLVLKGVGDERNPNDMDGAGKSVYWLADDEHQEFTYTVGKEYARQINFRPILDHFFFNIVQSHKEHYYIFVEDACSSSPE